MWGLEHMGAAGPIFAAVGSNLYNADIEFVSVDARRSIAGPERELL
jgi:hypothetical protein